ncbi:hypothetical protein PN462_02805 [Spirulina sp. CS-785/01]|uniref:hypothetical protein n=1 Tax=Spirulina sp. CS-785/01 TaxID=3021716 RepID=UPI00232C9E5E|nr:hypothetical protein [Spirulina sp. CS-785/01]MDB9312016.1 hypothetical protein [Spirulina sp. CS-785/01]
MRSANLLILLLLLGSLWGCSGGLGEVTTEQVTEQVGQPITISGEVVKQAPFGQGGGYQLADEEGMVWVMTERTLPGVGDRVQVTGEVREEMIEVDGQQLRDIYILESERYEL